MKCIQEIRSSLPLNGYSQIRHANLRKTLQFSTAFWDEEWFLQSHSCQRCWGVVVTTFFPSFLLNRHNYYTHIASARRRSPWDLLHAHYECRFAVEAVKEFRWNRKQEVKYEETKGWCSSCMTATTHDVMLKKIVMAWTWVYAEKDYLLAKLCPSLFWNIILYLCWLWRRSLSWGIILHPSLDPQLATAGRTIGSILSIFKAWGCFFRICSQAVLRPPQLIRLFNPTQAARRALSVAVRIYPTGW